MAANKYEKDLDEIINKNNFEEEPLPVDAMNIVLTEFNARMLTKIAVSLEHIEKLLSNK